MMLSAPAYGVRLGCFSILPLFSRWIYSPAVAPSTTTWWWIIRLNNETIINDAICPANDVRSGCFSILPLFSRWIYSPALFLKFHYWGSFNFREKFFSTSHLILSFGQGEHPSKYMRQICLPVFPEDSRFAPVLFPSMLIRATSYWLFFIILITNCSRYKFSVADGWNGNIFNFHFILVLIFMVFLRIT